MNPFKAIMSVIDGFELLMFSIFALVLIFWGVPFELFELYIQSKENHLWLFILISIIFIGLVLYAVRSLKLGRLSKANFCGNIIMFGIVGYGGLAMYLKMVQS